MPAGGDRAHAVEDVSLTVHRGEIVCVVGESGSGKSMLAGAVMGAIPGDLKRDAGVIRLGEIELTALSEPELRKIRGNRVAMIPQEPIAALNPVVRVGRQIEEVFALHTDLPAAERTRRALALLADMHLPDPERIARSYPSQLSGGQCQRVVIAMALALEPDLLIADEPTTALDVTTQAQILKLVCELRETHGHGVLFITHDVGVVAEIADRVVVMRKGQLVEAGEARQVLLAPAHPYTRELMAAAPGMIPPPHRPVTGEHALVARGLTKTYGARQALGGVDLEIRRGETLAIVGESGSGKSTLARILVRVIASTAGEAHVAGVDMLALKGEALRDKRCAVQMVFQDPFGSLNPRRRVGDMIVRAGVLAGARPVEARRRAEELLELVGLSKAAFHRRPAAFSGGQRQRVGIARALAANPDLLIADESVSALDVSVQAQILDLLRDLQDRLGLAILFITHDLRVAAQMGHRIAVMQHGVVVETGPAAEVLTRPSHPYTQALLAPHRGGSWGRRWRWGEPLTLSPRRGERAG
nr:ABC transporter ATP-binding protein [Phenylobacterium aquaticum]